MNNFKNWILDIETLAQESTSVVLSAALVYFETKIPVLMQDLTKQSIFIKFNVDEQRKKYNRIVSKDTMGWWSTQSQSAKNKSLIPSSDDVSVEDGFASLSKFFKLHGGTKNSHMYSRGAFDAIILDSLARAANIETLIHFSNHRDVRTFIDVTYPKSTNGYIKIDKTICPDYNESILVKHDPVSDCVMDICQMLAGDFE